MARLFADYALDISALNLNRLVTGYYDSQFTNNDYLTVGDYTYEDTLVVIYYSGGYASSFFGGNAFTFDGNGNFAGGTVTGYLQGIYSGTTPVPWWGIENFTYSAASMYNAALTSSTTDDYSIISSILSGDDQFFLSNYADHVNGYSGNDYFYAGAGMDVLDGGTGSDTAYYSEKTTAVKVTLNGSAIATVYVNNSAEDTIKNIENINGGSGADQLTGDSLANTLKGNGGNDTLNGGTGADTLIGGDGNDIYVVDNAGDVVTETNTNASQIDEVRSSLSWTLGAKLESLTLTGTAAINGTGNTLANTITGNAAANTLKGEAGSDILYGGLGTDSLYGGAGDKVKDVFDFNATAESKTGNTRDKVYDFTAKIDKIDLSGIDANTATAKAGDQAFLFNSTTAKANSVWHKVADADGVASTKDIIVYVDVNGDAKADFEVGLIGVTSIAATDFVL